MMQKQKEVFLHSEGDAWYLRNRDAMEQIDFETRDAVIPALKRCMAHSPQQATRLLEIGCSGGKRLQWIRDNLGLDCYGLEPSPAAVAAGHQVGLKVVQGTADQLPFDDDSFDYVIFGFCLYLCDREDLFKIAQEADRVLKSESWLIVYDFYSEAPSRREYHHRSGILSYKMDYRRLFDWHPSYTCYSHELRHMRTGGFTDDSDEWVATSVLRRKANG